MNKYAHFVKLWSWLTMVSLLVGVFILPQKTALALEDY